MNDTEQPCGHPWAAVVWLDEETCDCGACLAEGSTPRLAAEPPAAGEGEA